MAADLASFAQEQATAARLAGGSGSSGARLGTWHGIDASGQGLALVDGQEVRGRVLTGRGLPKGRRCVVRFTPQGNVIQF